LGDNDAAQSDYKCQDVAINWLVVFAVSTTKRTQIRIELILTQSLEHFGCRDETGQSRAEGSRKTTGVNQRTESRNQFNNLFSFQSL
ncbi:Uncharacterized protein APZ42_005571, partial [Daphnia magna]